MFDETNKREENIASLPEKLFGDDGDVTAAGIYEENQTDTYEAEEDKITIKYNGEEREISLDEARILAQKGMNYDHVVAERDTKYKRELDFLDRMAAEQGMSRMQYMDSREKNTAPEREAFGEAEASAERARAQIARISESVGLSGAWSNLFRAYPSLSRSEAEHELRDAVKGGLTPLEAYQQKLLSERERELRAIRQNEMSAMRSVGSLGSDLVKAEKDDFLEGFSLDD